jgi:hypothetical protein
MHTETSVSSPVNRDEMNWLPWPELAPLAGVEILRRAEPRESLLPAATQNSTSIVLDNCHASTSRVAQSITEAR